MLDVDLNLGGGNTTKLRPRVLHLDDGREFRWKANIPVGFIFQGEHGFRVTAEDTGRCRFEQFEVFSGLLSGYLLSRDGKKLETGFQAINRMLKREAEKRARDQA